MNKKRYCGVSLLIYKVLRDDSQHIVTYQKKENLCEERSEKLKNDGISKNWVLKGSLESTLDKKWEVKHARSLT